MRIKHYKKNKEFPNISYVFKLLQNTEALPKENYK